MNGKIQLQIAVTRDPIDPNEVCFRIEDGQGNLAPPAPTPEIRSWVEQLTIDAIHKVAEKGTAMMGAPLFFTLSTLIDEAAHRNPNPCVDLLPTRDDWDCGRSCNGH